MSTFSQPAYLSCPEAGFNVITFFLLEVDDQVVVVFEGKFLFLDGDLHGALMYLEVTSKAPLVTVADNKIS